MRTDLDLCLIVKRKECSGTPIGAPELEEPDAVQASRRKRVSRAAGCAGGTWGWRTARACACTEPGAPSTGGASMPRTVMAGPLQIFEPRPPVPTIGTPGSIWASERNSSSV